MKLKKLECLMLYIEQRTCRIGDEVKLSILQTDDGLQWRASLERHERAVMTTIGYTPIKAVRVLRDVLVEAGEDLVRLKGDGR